MRESLAIEYPLKATWRVVEKVIEQNTGTALAGVCAADVLRYRLTPAELQDHQHALRQQLLWVEDRLRVLSKRRGPRNRALSRLHGGTPEQREARKGHLQAIDALERALSKQRSILRQIGDAVAWIVLQMEPALLIPLWTQGGHHVPTGVGLGGQVAVTNTLHGSGKFLCLETDLTRCLGVGDLVIVPHGRDWSLPICVELKASGKLELGAIIDIEAHLALADRGESQESFAEIKQVLELQDEPIAGPAKDPEGRLQRQLKKLVQVAKALDRLSERLFLQTGPPPRRLWKAVHNVLRRGLLEGVCWDVPERGIAFAAVRVSPADDPAGKTREIIAWLRDAGFQEGHRFVTSDDFQDTDAFAAFIPPIPLWDLPREVRSALLSGQLHLTCVVRTGIWDEAMRSQGLAFRETEEGWIVGLDKKEMLFDHMSVGRVTLGLPFCGISPQQLAVELRTILEQE